MADQSNDRTIDRDTLFIGEGVTVTGDISVPGIVVVEGAVEGNLKGRAIFVTVSGVIKGTVAATEMEVHGTVSETVEVKQLLLVHATGRVMGNISYGELQLQKGAIISGTLSSLEASATEKEPKVEQLLGKSARPRIVHPIEKAPRPQGAAILPPADYKSAG